jgi:hypothetical protein
MFSAASGDIERLGLLDWAYEAHVERGLAQGTARGPPGQRARRRADARGQQRKDHQERLDTHVLECWQGVEP